MRYTFDVNVEAWVTNIDIEADSEEEALDELNKMSLYDFHMDGNVKDISIKEYDVEVEEPIEDSDEDDGLDWLHMDESELDEE